jgi:signal peptidase
MAAVVLVVCFVLVAVQCGWEFDAVLSGSMEPELAVGGLIMIKPVEAQHVSTGDIISFKIPDIETPICHRVIEITEIDGQLFFQTKGDANEEPDMNLVPAEAVKGEEVLYIPYVGNIVRVSMIGRERVNIMGKRLPKAVLVILPLGLLFIGLTVKDALEQIYRPVQYRRKEMLKKRRQRFAKRRAF